MSNKITFKRGGTFRRTGKVSRGNKQPVDITEFGISAQVRDGAKLVVGMQVDIVDGPGGRYTLVCEDTQAWPLGSLTMDICYKLPSGEIAYTPTITILCTKATTARPTL